MKPNIQLRLIVVLLLLIWLWAAIAPLSRSDWLLENLLVLFYAALLAHRAGLAGFWLDSLSLSLVMAMSAFYEQLAMLCALLALGLRRLAARSGGHG